MSSAAHNLPQSPPKQQPANYLESRLATFEGLADKAMSGSWSRFWLSQAEAIRQELGAVRPAGGEL